MAHDLPYQSALADAWLAFNQYGVAAAAGQVGDKLDQHVVLLFAADKGRRFTFGIDCGIARGSFRQSTQRQTGCGSNGARRVEKGAPLLRGNGERIGQPMSKRQ